MIPIFKDIRAICPDDGPDLITVVVDQSPLGKRFDLVDGKVVKTAAVFVSFADACQFHVPDHETLIKVLEIVSGSPHAAVMNCGWVPATTGVPFKIASRKALTTSGRDSEAVHDLDGVPLFGRLKHHARVSTWQVLDRDVDEHTPEWAKALDYASWRVKMDHLLPGFSSVAAVRALSASTRVLRDGQPVGGGNGHTWVKVADTNDVERTRTALIARAVAADQAWLKPRMARDGSGIVGQGWTTICDPSVWLPGRLLFVGQPVVSEPLKLAAPRFVQLAGTPTLDTSQAQVSVSATLRQSVKAKSPMLFSAGHLRQDTLTLKTVLELADGTKLTVAQALADGRRFRCQAPFRASESVAAFFDLDGDGNPFVHDSGTGTTYRIATPDLRGDTKTIVAKMVAKVQTVMTDDEAKALAPWCINADVVSRAVGRSFWNPEKGKLMVLADRDGMKQFTQVDAKTFALKNLFGNFLNRDLLIELVKADDVSDLMTGQAKLFVEHVVTARQANHATLRVDMFATAPSLTFADGEVDIVLRHRPFPESLHVTNDEIRRVWNDFSEHFPEFRSLVDFVLYGRFCSGTRRRAFAWLHANSDWGKGLLAQVFKRLGILVEAAIKEIDKACAGEPSGVDPDECLRSWILFVDEWKSANAELKRLNDSINIAAKGKMRVSVPLYTKLFASAEEVSSLTNGGVESQYKERFSYLNPPPARFDDRDLRNEIGSTEYLRVLSEGVARYLNVKVREMVAMGPVKADSVSMAWLEQFHAEHLLTDTFESLETNLEAIAENIRSMVRSWDKETRFGNRLLRTPRRLADVLSACKQGYVSGRRAIQLTDAVLDAYRDLTTNRSTNAKVAYKNSQIKELIDEGDTKSRKYRLAESKDDKVKVLNPTNGPVVFIDEPEELPAWLC